VGNPEESVIVWTDYMKYRAGLRGFELSKIENILRHSGERYFDTTTQRLRSRSGLKRLGLTK